MSSIDEARYHIYSVDLSEVRMRLIKIEGWRNRDADEAIEQYRNYLFLRRKYPGEHLPPSKDIDEVWHAHVLHTKHYREFCERAFSHEEGQYLDHHPHLAEEGSMDRLSKLFERVQNLYHQEFGTYMYQITGRSFLRRCLDWFRDRLAARYPQMVGVQQR